MKSTNLFQTIVLTGAVMVAGASRAAILTGVPMQGGMAMPMVSYQSSDGRIHVIMPGSVPALTPLLVSNPTDSFDPADPWYGALDPAIQGLSFSRRYGFVIDTVNGSDPLPAGTQIWIRKLSGPPELKFYRYNGSEPKEFTPIFGTDGAPATLYWDAMMFHPVVTAPPGTNDLVATFEVYLHDTVSGQEVAGSSSGPLPFPFHNLPDGRPALALAPKVFVAWPSGTSTNWVLECAASASSADWVTVTNAPATVDGQPGAVLTPAASQQYFRMRYLP